VESPTPGWRAVHVLTTAGLLHLIAQDFWAMAVPFLLTFLPAWLALRWAVGPVFSRPLHAEREWWPRRLAPLRPR
jgi:apolipoprotein N-acyltransferase